VDQITQKTQETKLSKSSREKQYYFPLLPFESEYEILICEHSNERYWAVLSCGAVYYAVQGGSNFWFCDVIIKCDHSMKATEKYFPMDVMLYKLVQTSESLDHILKCDHSNGNII